ncbi:DNA alkylation repair protein [Dinghuibacter silviterrae]|uniref:DNA alkylation repair enzyme n=1 Tax=Dinghuibacter silviterrae TaxID=1539049 RepID=A0A4R8DVQ4_9BACT|nr:DNA alkylation repair protein [Dinghuibacter silviterrae]TDX02008.1 DNA alkylation repair enzyme [Dinghuibacter silviterrae]
MPLPEIMSQLEALSDESTRKIMLKHGIREPLFGVKMEHLKNLAKKLKRNHDLSLALFATGNADAMYLAGLVAEPAKMTEAELRTWVSQALSHSISEYTVPGIAAAGPHGATLAMEWIDAPEEHIAAGGYVPELTEEAIAVARSIGVVYVDMGDTACKVPEAEGYIRKMLKRK